MDPITFLIFTTISIWQCDGISIREQLEHIAKRRKESQGLANFLPSRRYYEFQPSKSSVILGAPTLVSHLPEAEPILPGHTLIRPALDMLKSSVKFPHKDMDNGAGVYGNIDNLGLRYDGRNEYVLYSGFRRMNDETMANDQPLEDSRKPKVILAILRGNNREQKESLHKEFKKRNNKPNVAPYVYVDFDNISGLLTSDNLRQNMDDNKNEVHNEGVSEYEDSSDIFPGTIEIQQPKEYNTDNEEVDPKLTWFWNSKDIYNNIKINPEAPELNDLVPAVYPENTKKWWFFHQADYEPFEKLN